jgi:hypothetical protein
MKRKSLKVLGLVVAIIVMAILGAANAALYCSEPTRVTQELDNNGEVTMTITTSVPDEYYRSELGTIGESVETHSAKEEAVQKEIMTNTNVTVYFYVYGEGYYPCTINRATGEITVTLIGDDVPLPGSWVALRFCGIENDTHDKTVYNPLSGTLLNEWKVPGYGDKIPLSVLGWSSVYC